MSGRRLSRDRSLQILIGVTLFLIFVAVTLLYRFYLPEGLPTSFLDNQVYCCISPLFEGVGIHYFGFLVPLVVSLMIAVPLVHNWTGITRNSAITSERGQSILTFVGIMMTVLGGLAGLVLPSTLIPYGNTNPIAAYGLLLVLLDLIIHNNGDLALYLAYPLGFALGFISDLESAAHISGIWGGLGLFDGDFFEPFAFLIAVFVAKSAFETTRDPTKRQLTKCSKWLRRKLAADQMLEQEILGILSQRFHPQIALNTVTRLRRKRMMNDIPQGTTLTDAGHSWVRADKQMPLFLGLGLTTLIGLTTSFVSYLGPSLFSVVLVGLFASVTSYFIGRSS